MSRWILWIIFICYRGRQVYCNGVQLPVSGSDVTVFCDENEIRIKISADYVARSSGWLKNERRLCLLNRACKGKLDENGDVLINITNNFMQCGNEISLVETVNAAEGTVAQSYYKFRNRLLYDGLSNVIDRDINLLEFSCLYPATVAQPEEVETRVIKIREIGGEIFLIDKVQDDRAVTEDEISIKISVPEPNIPVGAPEYNYVAVASKCWVENDGDEYQFVQNGCPTVESDIFNFTSQAATLDVIFNLDTTHFISNVESGASIHCIVGLCDTLGSNTCVPTCDTQKRRRRGIKDNDTNDESSEKKNKYKVEIEEKEFILNLHPKVEKPTVDRTFALETHKVSMQRNGTLSNVEITINENTEAEEKIDIVLIALMCTIAIIFIIIIILSAIVCRRMRNPQHQSC